MSIHPQFRRISEWLATAVALLFLASTAARAEIIPLATMMHGIEMTAGECAARPLTVWVHAYGQGFCIRYYLSNAGGSGDTPIVFLSGDKLGVFNRTTRTFSPRPNEHDVDTDALAQRADAISRIAGTTAIYLARPGIDGSSGHHGNRKSLLELAVVDAALDAIKRRHHFAGFHLVGQSGGAALVARLPAQRHDIGCAVPGSGPLSWDDNKSPSPALHFADPSEVVTEIARNRTARILVVTDPADETVLFERQMKFVRKLRQVGGQVDQFLVQATDSQHHGVMPYSTLVVAECVHGTPTAAISRKLATYVQDVVASLQTASSVAR